MSDLTAAIQSIKSEVKIDDQGKVSMTQYAVSRLLQISHVFLTRNDFSKKLAERLSTVGLQVGSSFPPGHLLNEAQVAIIIDYYAFDAQRPSEVARQINRAMSAVGVRAFFQQQLGFVPQEPQGNTDKNWQLRQLIQSASKLLEIEDYAADKPGLELVLSSLDADSKALPGTITLGQFLEAEYPGRVFCHADLCHVGSFVAVTYRNTYGKPPERRNVPATSVNGRRYYPQQPVYPVDFVPYMRAAVELGLNTQGL